MPRIIVAASLLLALLAGCSSSQPPKASDPPAPQPSVQPVAAPSPVATPTATPAPRPAAKPARPKSEKAAKQYTGSPTDRLAQCLADKGAVMYGVFWCDHCREQKVLFGDSFKYVKYVECVTEEAPRTLLPECKAQGIKHTPTWIFPDGARLEGSQPLSVLSDKTGCQAP